MVKNFFNDNTRWVWPGRERRKVGGERVRVYAVVTG